MYSQTPILNFCPPITFSTASHLANSFSTYSVSPRRPRYNANPSSSLSPTMSLVNDLIVKGVEVGIATYVGNATFTAQTKKPTKKKKSGIFSAFQKQKETTPPPSASAINDAITEVVRLANELPNVVERGGPEGKKWVKLAICIGIDLVGSGSLGVPILGDALDLVTAPLTAVMLQALFANSLVTFGGLAEELLPGTDGIPTATLAWFAENYGYLNNGEKGEDNARRG